MTSTVPVRRPVKHQHIASLVMHLLNLTDKHLSRIVQRSRNLFQNQGGYESETLAFRHVVQVGQVKRSGLGTAANCLTLASGIEANARVATFCCCSQRK